MRERSSGTRRREVCSSDCKSAKHEDATQQNRLYQEEPHNEKHEQLNGFIVMQLILF